MIVLNFGVPVKSLTVTEEKIIFSRSEYEWNINQTLNSTLVNEPTVLIRNLLTLETYPM